MHRRAFLATLVSSALAGPVAARAQAPALPVVGFLNGASPGPFAHLVAGFRKGLNEAGYVEGRNVAVEYRWAQGRYDRLTALAADLVKLNVGLIVATGGENSAVAAKAATSTIPIVFAIGGDPVEAGLVASLNRPGGNLTGLTQYTGQLEGKRLGLLRETLPTATTFALLVNPAFALARASVRDAEEAAAQAGLRMVVLAAAAEKDFETVFARLVKERTDGLVVAADPFFNSRRALLVTLAERHKVPAIYEFREFAEAGGLMSYGANLAEGYRQVGLYTGRVLKGARPADLPVLQPTTFELVVNLRAARAVGVTFPQSVLVRADEVIR
jgi:putative ABC transport system substrate-binding protein